MLNTPFDPNWDKETRKEMTKLWASIFAVAMEQNLPMLKTIIWMNDNFEDIYSKAETDTEVWQKCFDSLGILWTYK